MNRRRTRWIVLVVALAVGAGAVYAASGSVRGWLVHTLHGR